MKPAKEMIPLLQYLLGEAVPAILCTISELDMVPMKDGGMGSHRFFTSKIKSKFGRVAAECQFMDADGTPVLATLNLDKDDELFELDIWKVDFSALVKWPSTEQINKPSYLKTESITMRPSEPRVRGPLDLDVRL